MSYSSDRIGFTTVLVCSLLWQSCQSSLRQMQTEEPTSTASSGEQVKEPTSSYVVATPTLGAQDARKRSVSELSQCTLTTEESKESPSTVASRQPLTDTCVFSREVAQAAVTQELQGFGIADAIAFAQKNYQATTQILASFGKAGIEATSRDR